MRWLLWKEYRLNRPIVFATLFLLIVPHLFAIYATLRYGGGGLPWQRNVAMSSFFSLLLSQLALALIGGNVIAAERADRSAEFQVYLPLARSKILAAKVLLALAIAAVIWLTNPLILLGVEGGWKYVAPFRTYQQFFQLLFNTAITGLTFFCVAWLFSSFLTSPTFSVCAGLITPLLVASGMLYVAYLFDILEGGGEIFELCYRGICLVTAPLCFAVGTWIYLRRVEP